MDDFNSQPESALFAWTKNDYFEQTGKAILHGKDINDRRSVHHCLLFIAIQPIDHISYIILLLQWYSQGKWKHSKLWWAFLGFPNDF